MSFELTKEGEKQLKKVVDEACKEIELIVKNKMDGMSESDLQRMMEILPTKERILSDLNSGISGLYFYGDLRNYEITNDLYYYNRWYYSNNFYASIILKYKTHFRKSCTEKLSNEEIMPTAIISCKKL